MRKLKSLFAAAAAVVMTTCVLGAEPTGVLVNGVDIGTKSSGDGWNYDSAHRINIKGAKRFYAISGEDKSGIGIRIKIEASCVVVVSNLTLQAMNSHCNALWLDTSKGSLGAEVQFCGKNTLIGGFGAAAIGVKDGQSISLFGCGKDAELIVQGGKGGAGIGGDDGDEKVWYSNCGTVKIDGGRIVATGGAGAAGIGGGGGNICTDSGSSGGHGGKVTISDEHGGSAGWDFVQSTEVIATGGEAGTMTDNGGAGIGGGSWDRIDNKGEDSSGGSVTIEGGKIVATGGRNAAGIGGAMGWNGRGGSMDSFSISGGTVEASGSKLAAAIGGADTAKLNYDFAFTMSGGHVRALGDYRAIGGGGEYSEGGTIKIYGGTLEASWIGGGWNSFDKEYEWCEIYIRGGSVILGSKKAIDYCQQVMAEDCGQPYQTPVCTGGFKPGEKLTIAGLKNAMNPGEYYVNDIVADEQGSIWLWLPDGKHYMTINGEAAGVNVKDAWANDWEPISAQENSVEVVWDADGGIVFGNDGKGNAARFGTRWVQSVLTGTKYKDLKQYWAVREGYTFRGWWTNHSLDADTEIEWKDLTFTALWTKNAEDNNYIGNTGDSEEVPAAKPACVTFDAVGGKVEGSDKKFRYVEVGKEIGSLPTAVRQGYVFAGWRHVELVNPIQATATVWGDVTLYAFWEKAATLPTKHVYLHCCQGEANDGPVYDYEYANYGAGSQVWYQSAPPYSGLSPNQEFVGWFSQKVGGQAYPAWKEVVNPGDEHYYAQWKTKKTKWMVNRYFCAKLTDLIANCPDLSDVKSVTKSGLPKGLNIVQDKSKTDWYVEGVATETLDGESNFAVVNFTCKTKGNSIPTQKLLLMVKPEETVAAEECQDALYEIAAQDLFGDIIGKKTVDSTWKMAISPSGVIKYATKDNTKWKDSSKTEFVEDAFTFYGELTKLGPYTITASVPVTSQVPGLTTKYTEKYAAEVLVTPVGGFDEDHTIDLTVNVKMEPYEIVSFASLLATDKNTKPTASMPAGLKFTNKAISNKTDGEVPAGSFYGTPTKLGKFVVTLKDKDKVEESFLFVIRPAAATKVLVGVGSSATALKKKVIKGDQQAEDLGAYTLMVGANVNFPIAVDKGATVKQSGLPTGLKLAQDRSTQDWFITGYPTKTGTFHATLTATLNKVSTSMTIVFEVVANEFVGEYRGHMVSYFWDDRDKFTSPMIVNVAAGGAVSVSLTELGVTTKYSAKSFNWDELNGNAWIEFETKKTTKLPFVRKVHIDIVGQDGWKLVSGSVTHPASLGVDDGAVEAWPVVPQQVLAKNLELAELAKPLVWNFTEDVWSGEGVYVAFSLATSWLDAKKGTAKVSVKDVGGAKYAFASLPVVRIGEDETDPASYAVAPFGCYSKSGEVTTLYFLALDGSDFSVTYDYDSSIRGEYVEADVAEYEYSSKQKPFAEMLSDESFVMCEFDSGSTETFEIVLSNKGQKADVYDSDGNKLVSLSVKLAQDGTVSFKFTDKNKVTYSFELGWLGDQFFRGFVTKSWKNGKETKYDWARVEIF